MEPIGDEGLAEMERAAPRGREGNDVSDKARAVLLATAVTVLEEINAVALADAALPPAKRDPGLSRTVRDITEAVLASIESVLAGPPPEAEEETT